MTIRRFMVVALLGCAGQTLACAAEAPQTARGTDPRAEALALNDSPAGGVAMVRQASVGYASEMRACAGIPEADRAAGPFAHARITRVTPLYDHLTRLKASWTELRGSTIELQAAPSVTKQWITRLAQCQIANLADHGAGDHSGPLGVGRVQVSVEDSSTGFVVSIRTEQLDKLLAQRVLESSQALLQPGDAI